MESTPGDAIRAKLAMLVTPPAPGRGDLVPATEVVAIAEAALAEFARLDALVAHLRRGGSIAPPTTPPPPPGVPVHRGRYHRHPHPGDAAVWLEVSIDGGPWRKVGSSWGPDPYADAECPEPDLGEEALGDRAPWHPVTPLVEPGSGT